MQNLAKVKCNSTELRSFVTGLILGDGHIGLGVTKRNFDIKSINKDFIDYITETLKAISPFKFYVKEVPAYTKEGVHHKKYWELRIKQHPYFRKLYPYFYNDYRHRKIYSKTINWLTPIGLANWYMSDGYRCLVGKTKDKIRNRRIDICTDRYFKEDVELMISILEKKFNIKCSLIKRNNTYRIRINSVSYGTFINLIKPYIVSSMLYKLYLGYENQPKNLTDSDWEYQKYLLSAITLTSDVEG